MTGKRQQARRRQAEQAWDHLTGLLISRHEVTKRGLGPRAVRDLIDLGRDSDLPVETWADQRIFSGDVAKTGYQALEPRISVLLRAGWPVTAYAQIERLAQAGLDSKCYLSRSAALVFNPTLERMAGILAETAEEASKSGASWINVFGWLEVLVQEMDEECVSSIWQAVIAWSSAAEFLPGHASLADHAAMLGSTAPIAWAAGIPAEEAAEQQRTGVLTVDGLRTLASLRGFEFGQVLR